MRFKTGGSLADDEEPVFASGPAWLLRRESSFALNCCCSSIVRSAAVPVAWSVVCPGRVWPEGLRLAYTSL